MKKSTKITLIIIAVLLVAATALAAFVQISANSPLNPDKYITLGQYKGVEIERVVPKEVTDEDIQSRIDSALESHAEEQDVTDRPAQKDDILSIDYIGTIDGEAFDGGTGENKKCVIGAGGYIDGFEEGLVGANVGDTVELNLTFPEDYTRNEELSGKAVTFSVTVNSIKNKVLPEYNDAFVSENYDYATTAEYEAYLRKSLENSNQEAADTARTTAAWEAAKANAIFSGYPEREMNNYVNKAIASYTYMAKNYYGVTLSEFLDGLYGITEEDFRADLEEEAKLAVEDLLLVKAIAKAEGITISDEEYEAGKLAYIADMGYADEAAFKEKYGKSFDEYYGEDYLQDSLLATKVEEFVVNAAVEVDPAE